MNVLMKLQILRGEFYYYHHLRFINEGTKTERGSETHLGSCGQSRSGGARIRARAVGPEPTLSAGSKRCSASSRPFEPQFGHLAEGGDKTCMFSVGGEVQSWSENSLCEGPGLASSSSVLTEVTF